MRSRRDFLAFSAMALAVPVAARAQPKSPTIGILSVDTAKPSPWLQFLLGGLREKGYAIDRNLTIDDRTVAHYGGLAEQAASLARANVAVIAALGATATLAAAKATKSIPIVMVAGIDAVAAGLAATLSHPGGNVTGVDLFASALQGKRLELLKELVPPLRRVGVLAASDAADSASRLKETEAAARSLKLFTHVVELRAADKLDEAFAELARSKIEALVVFPGRVMSTNSARIADLAAQRRLPAVSPHHEFVEAGGLASYGVNYRDAFVTAAAYVDRILKGAKPGDLPIAQPTKFELAINLKTAKTLGLKIPQSVLVRADRVIQ